MKKRILLVINTLGRAGAERAFIELLNNFDYDSFEVDVFVLTGMGELFEELPKQVRILNDKYISKPVLDASGQNALRRLVIRKAFTKNGLKNWSYILSNLSSQLKAGKVKKDKLLWKMLSDTVKIPNEIRNTTYDTAIAFLEGGSTYFVGDSVLANRKVAFVHVGYTQAGYNRKLDGDAYSKFDKVYTVSEDVRDGFVSIYPELTSKVDIFPMIINHDFVIKGSKAEISIEKKSLTLVTVARLTKQKGCDLLVEAARVLRNCYGEDFCWYIVGDGPEHKQLDLYLKRHGLTKQVKILGVKNNPYPYFNVADIYVQPSLFEGRSIAVQEAKILNKLIVVTDVTGMSEIITDEKTGLIVKPTVSAIVEGIMRLNSDEKLRNSILENLSLCDYKEEKESVKKLIDDMLQ